MSALVSTVLVYVDGSEESLVACEYAVLLAKETGAELIAAYIINTRALGDLVRSRIFLAEEEREYTRDLEADADRYLNHAERVGTQKGVRVETLKRTGGIHQELLRIIDERRVDLLVLGELAHVRSRRDEFYNEAERAMRSARCSVLIVKDEERVSELFERTE